MCSSSLSSCSNLSAESLCKVSLVRFSVVRRVCVCVCVTDVKGGWTVLYMVLEILVGCDRC